MKKIQNGINVFEIQEIPIYQNVTRISQNVMKPDAMINVMET